MITDGGVAMKAMLVKDLIKFLERQPQDIPVAFECCSEQLLLKESDIEIEKLCLPRNDGWVQNARPDRAVQEYLVFPGN